MGREIRRVPVGWEHPKYTEEDARYTRSIGTPRPLLEQPYKEACAEWDAELAEFRKQMKKPPDQREHAPSDVLVTDSEHEIIALFIEWHGEPTKPEHHMPDFGDQQLGYCIYEDVSEGTPMSPVFATEAELVDWIVNDGGEDGPKSRTAAERFVKEGSVPTMMFTPEAGLRMGIDMLEDAPKK